jgi:hypothetical protein
MTDALVRETRLFVTVVIKREGKGNVPQLFLFFKLSTTP